MQEEALWACSACPHAPEMPTRSGWADHVKRSPRPYTDASPTRQASQERQSLPEHRLCQNKGFSAPPPLAYGMMAPTSPNSTHFSSSLVVSAPGRSGRVSLQTSGASADRVPGLNTEVLILDEHPAILEAVTGAVEQEEGLKVGGTATTAEEALEAVKTRSPGVFITEISLRGADGLNLIEEVLGKRPDTEVLVYSILKGELHVWRALRAGARGYVNKSASTTRLIGAVRRVLRGEISLIPDVTSQILGDAIHNRKYSTDPSEQLTNRELTVFQMMGRGQSVRSIANQLDLSRKTVETHRRRAKEKLRHETLESLLRHAIEWGSNR